MTVIQFFFADTGQSHEIAQAATKPLLNNWYVVLPLVILLVMLVTIASYLISKRSKLVAYNVLLATLFILGVASYTWSTVVSVCALSVGFGLALLQLISGLTSPIKLKGKK